jgi:hypothetical protein
LWQCHKLLVPNVRTWRVLNEAFPKPATAVCVHGRLTGNTLRLVTCNLWKKARFMPQGILDWLRHNNTDMKRGYQPSHDI